MVNVFMVFVILQIVVIVNVFLGLCNPMLNVYFIVIGVNVMIVNLFFFSCTYSQCYYGSCSHA
jgi:hypothetical protein